MTTSAEPYIDRPECEACRMGSDRHEPAAYVYELATARARILVCCRHADMMRGWAGTLSQIEPEKLS